MSDDDLRSHRRWLRPKWYVTSMGVGVSCGSPWPDAVTFVPQDQPDPICVGCGVDCPDGGYDVPDGYLCVPCHDVANPRPVRLSWPERVLEHIDATLDNLYFSYAFRFGKREYR